MQRAGLRMALFEAASAAGDSASTVSARAAAPGGTWATGNDSWTSGISAAPTVVGEAADGVEAVDLARRLLPDVVVMDIALPRLDGLAATRAIRRSGLPVRVLILAGQD